MEVTLFIGGSGTGKSYQAMNVAKARGIRYIIDDGLLIRDNRVLGGASAKRERSRLGAIRRAIFTEKQHRQRVKTLIQDEVPDKIMVLGTSRKMVDTIVEQLELELPARVIWIEEVVGEDEIRLAKKIRMREGKHVIPVPAFELKKDFSGYFLNPLKTLRGLGKTEEERYSPEKSVVRPTFSYLGRYTISDGVIRSLVNHAVTGWTELIPAGSTFVKNTPVGLFIEMDVKAPYGISLTQQVRRAQDTILVEVEGMTALHVASVNITVKKWVE